MRAAYSSAFLFYVLHGTFTTILRSRASNTESLLRRGECDSFCNKATATFTACESAANPDQCACTLANYNLLHDCFTCTITAAQGNEHAVGALAQQADAEEKQFFANCAATGYTLTGSTASGGTTAGGVSSGTTSGVGARRGRPRPLGVSLREGVRLPQPRQPLALPREASRHRVLLLPTGTSTSTTSAIAGGGLQGSASRSASWSNFGVVTLAIVISAILL
ncbi:hypothetical protein DFP72DRAFT_938203 [Ephemerocybe angulata]|uniref:Uncharacterized protein n=1 Tax=Ephemerocybe angulata TaxID=980116 RepID=A0A8H6HAB3_9AGAR|nr:hypothetical protein DFP72DRAFT_938203 [Tulosesus angulatus]